MNKYLTFNIKKGVNRDYIMKKILSWKEADCVSLTYNLDGSEQFYLCFNCSKEKIIDLMDSLPGVEL